MRNTLPPKGYMNKTAISGGTATLAQIDAHSDSDTRTVNIRHGETVIVFDLMITNDGGGRMPMEGKGRERFVDLTMQSPHAGKKIFLENFPNDQKDPEDDIYFDDYIVRVDRVQQDAEIVKLTVTNTKYKKQHMSPL